MNDIPLPFRIRCFFTRLVGLRREFVDAGGQRHIHDRTMKGKCWLCETTEMEKRRVWKAFGFSDTEIAYAARRHRANGGA
jgi:hypothetical protein